MKRALVVVRLVIIVSLGVYVGSLQAQNPYPGIPLGDGPHPGAVQKHPFPPSPNWPITPITPSPFDPAALGTDAKGMIKKHMNKKGLGCWAHFNCPACGSCNSECLFLFGSCRQFFGENCPQGPQPYGVTPVEGHQYYKRTLGLGGPDPGGSCPTCR
jgi:hypothetical protein